MDRQELERAQQLSTPPGTAMDGQCDQDPPVDSGADTETGNTSILKHQSDLEEMSLAAIPAAPGFDIQSKDQDSKATKDNEAKASLKTKDTLQDDSQNPINSVPSPDLPSLKEAIQYINQVRHQFSEEPEKYPAFLDILYACKDCRYVLHSP